MSTTTVPPSDAATATHPQPRAAFWLTAGLVAAWLAGIGAQTWLDVPLWFTGIATAGAAALAAGAVFGRLPSAAVTLAIVLALLWAGAARAEMAAPERGEGGMLYYATGADVRLTGVIEGDPSPSASGKSVSFKLLTKQIGGRDTSGGVQVRAFAGRAGDTGDGRAWQAGDLVELRGKLMAIDPRMLSNDDGYNQYLARQGIYARMDFPTVQLLADKQDNSIVHALGDVRHWATDVITRNVGDQEGALLVGILLGNKNGINAQTRAAFQNSGTAHIVAISGSNISIVIAFVAGAFRWWGRRNAMVVAVLCVIAYTIMVGASASVVRAALMGIIAAFGLLVGRGYDGLSALAVAAFLMTLYDPHLFWDVGFQLSCMATLGILLLGEPLQRRLRLLPPLIREIIALTIAAELFVLPLGAFYFGGISYTFLPANVMAVPALPLTMAMGALAIIGGILPAFLATGLGFMAKIPLAYMIAVVDFFSISQQKVSISPFALAYYYAGLALVISYARLRQADALQSLSRWQITAIAAVGAMSGAAILFLT